MKRILCLILSLSMLVGWSTPDSTIKMGPSSTGDRSIIAEQGAGASNPKIKYDSASSGWQFSNDGTSFKNFGSGSGQSNAFIFNDFEDNSVANWATYADAAAATPVDGTGGSATTLTVTASSSSPLNGTFSMSLAKSAANGQGEGIAAAFSIPSGYQQGAERSLEFLWDGSGANYVAGDMRVYIYDVTNATLITPQPYTELPAAKTPIQLYWDASTSGSYRLIFHVATTNASDYTVKIDDVVVGPGEIIVGYATPDSAGLVSTGTQSFAGVKTFNNGLKFDEDADQTAMTYYREGTHATTFTSNGTGGGTSSSVDIVIRRFGNMIFISIPPFNASPGTGSPTTFTSNSALPTWARPTQTAVYQAGYSRNNGATDSSNIAKVIILGSGIITVNRNASDTAWSTTSTAGLHTTANVTYYIQ